MKKRYWTLLTIVIISLLYYAYHYWKYTPQRNPHPQYFMTVSGNVAPSLRDKVHLKWTATYSTTKRACDKTYNHFEGVVGWRWVTRTFTAQVDHTGHYQLRIPLDYYKPGYCGWAMESMAFKTNNDSPIDITEFGPCGNSATCMVDTYKITPFVMTATNTLACKKYSNDKLYSCSLVNILRTYNSTMIVPRTQSYQFILNVKS